MSRLASSCGNCRPASVFGATLLNGAQAQNGLSPSRAEITHEIEITTVPSLLGDGLLALLLTLTVL